jgi:two-component system NtrC family sensor kinase
MGVPFSSIPMIGNQCAQVMDRVYRTGEGETQAVRENTIAYPFYSYALWPVVKGENRTHGIMLQVIEGPAIQQDAIAMNSALMLGLIRQHEFTETAEALNTALHFEMAARKKAEEALIRSEKLASVGRMSAVIAHEINNPLAAVMDLVYLAQSVDTTPERIRECLAIADGELKRIAHITRQTLGFYREIFIPTTFDVASLLDSVTDLLQAKLRSKQANLIQRCDKTLQITSVYGELRQVFSNLLANSVDAIDERGRITVKASSSHNPHDGTECIRITIADDGRGIDQAALQQIFEAFFTTKGTTGNGLGLWVSKQLIEKHGGSIRFRSCTTGKYRGTTFSICSPKIAI